MNNIQITSLINSCPSSRQYFRGVYASDTLPRQPDTSKPCTYICNLDPSCKPGSHWIAFFVPKRGLIEYFDSYGMDPPPCFRNFWGEKGYRCNTTFLQYPFSAVCGQYAIYYIWQRSLHSSMDDVLRIFHRDNQLYNDLLVNHLVEEHFDVDLSVFDIPWQVKQYSIALNVT